MGTIIASADKAQIESLAAHASTTTMRRRAQLLLLYDQGLDTQAVADQVDLSASRARYWRRRYLFEGMQIFAGSSLNIPSSTPVPGNEETQDLQLLPEKIPAEQISKSAKSLPKETPAENPPVSLAELRQRYPSNLHQAEHRRDLALTLFDAFQPIHHLPSELRRLLEVAALLQYLTENQQDDSSTKSGYLFILSNPLTDLTESETKLVETTLASLHGKVKYPRSPTKRDQILSPAEHEALTLAALLRIAHGLDTSQTQTTVISSIEIKPEQITLLIKGPQAKLDVRKAGKSSKLWTRLYGQKIRLQVIYQIETDQDKRLEELISRTKPGIEPNDALAEAGRKVMGFHFAQMILHEAGTRLGEDIEELHDMRVATRRMRAAFEVFGEAFNRKALKIHLKGLRATGRALGRVRDLDVFMEKAQQYLDTLPQEQRDGLDPLLTLWKEERRSDRIEMLAYLNSEDYATFKRRFLTFVSTPGAGAKVIPANHPYQVQHVVPILVYTRLASVLSFGTTIDSATTDQLHALRIEFKKLRYTLEFFSEVLGEESKGLITEIKSLQDHLGDLNDADVACMILREFLDNWEANQEYLPINERENPEPIVAYLANKHAERYFLTTTFQDVWKKFDQPETRSNFALAISVL
ncbi:MAG: CHAD domain-containing protein [Anaerolineales bacterium]|jgi:CHAD domain-containing protein